MTKNTTRKGFTLIELSVVLIIIGLLIGMAFKGFDLIKTSSVVSEANKIQKITSAVVTFKSIHKRLPGDGCSLTVETTAICTGDSDGSLGETGTYKEVDSFWEELYIAGLITAADRASEIGGANYTIANDITNGHKGIYLAIATAPIATLCELDATYGDGDSDASKKDSLYTATDDDYNTGDDCTAKTGSGPGKFLIFKK